MICKTEKDAAEFIRKLAEYELISCCIWIAIAVLQICTCYGSIAGVWNICVGVSRYRMIARIKARDARIPSEHERLEMLIVIALVNLILGGVIGIALVAFDYYVRNQILENRHVFNCEAPDEGTETQTQAPHSTEHNPGQDEAMDLLTRLSRLREQGALTLQEFTEMKQSLLDQFRQAK